MVERLKRERPVEVEWKPFFLHPETPPEGFQLPPQVRARFASSHARLDQMAQAAGLLVLFQKLQSLPAQQREFFCGIQPTLSPPLLRSHFPMSL